MAYLFCNQCGHRNPPASLFCSSCGWALDSVSNRTVTLARMDPGQDAPGPADDLTVDLDQLDQDVPALSRSLAVMRAPADPTLQALRGLPRHPGAVGSPRHSADLPWPGPECVSILRT